LLQKVGLVSGAVWSDLDQDGWAELILACEWGPVRVYGNRGGKLTERTKELGLEGQSGWWSGVTTGDLDGDGKPDVVASNWGWNSSYHRPSAEEPAVMYYGDLDEKGTWELVETEREGGRQWPRRNLGAMSETMPWLRLNYPTHHAYAMATLEGILGERMKRAREVKATTLASTVFLNRGGKFEARPMPAEAQWAPAQGVVVGDMDGDGMEDVFLAQNYFSVRPDEPRLDAGRGLWLRGTGQGKLEAMSGAMSGVMIYGEQRGAALGDYDGDGRVDLVVGQNDGPTMMYHNERGRAGLRVRLGGPVGNPDGIGAGVRLKFKEGAGPVREVKGGGGYWSQDSVVLVMATPMEPQEIEVRWPGGAVTTGRVPPGAREIKVLADGAVSVTSKASR
jgi:hypothetical protein